MDNNLERILLQMKYDSKKTLSENYENLNLLTEGTTSKEYTLQMRTNNMLGVARQTFTIPKGLPITKRGDIIEIGSANSEHFYGYGCTTKKFGYMGSLSGSQGAGYENSELAKLLDVECTQSEKKTTFDWMARGDDKYWATLKTALEKNTPLIPYVKESTDSTQGKFYYWNNFVVWRNNGAFITHRNPDVGGKIDPTTYNGKYAGQPSLSSIALIVDGKKISVLDFIQKYSAKKQEGDYRGDAEPKPGGGSSQPTSNNWKNCKGTYSVGCESQEVGTAQQCLKDAGIYPYRVDNKFGRRTKDAVFSKIGKSSFTDSDLQTICKTKQGGGGDDDMDFDKDNRGGSEEREKEDTTWTGEVY